MEYCLYLPSAPASPLGPCGPASPVAILLLMTSCSHLEGVVTDVELPCKEEAFSGEASPAYKYIPIHMCSVYSYTSQYAEGQVTRLMYKQVEDKMKASVDHVGKYVISLTNQHADARRMLGY